MKTAFEILSSYVNSDQAGDKITSTSTTGSVFKLFEKRTICWNTRIQPSVANSATAAEYI